MQKWLGKIHLCWCLAVFAILFLLFFPLLLIPILFKSQHALTGKINRAWARILFPCSFLPYRIEVRGTLKKDSQYIFCPNHFSYLDIPVMGLTPINCVFVGKHDMERVPLFGFMYSQLHITVNRGKLKSKYSSFRRAAQALDENKSLIIFPEGGIVSQDFPNMARFKDGAFRLAIEKQIPIVPVTLLTNWKILPDERFYLTRQRIQIIFHEPIAPQGHTIQSLRETTFGVIQTKLLA